MEHSGEEAASRRRRSHEGQGGGQAAGHALHYLDVTTVAAMIRRREISAREVTDHLLARVAALDLALHSYAFVDASGARRQADAADAAIRRGELLGPLHGVPVAVKDIFWTHDMPTAAGMSIYRDFQPATDATVVARLRQAGAILLGKLQMTEGAFALHHPTVTPPLNPWGAELWPGASSSGSGVATAAGLCFASLGSDTGGSIRFPCAATGLTGLKPTWGSVSRHGVFALAPSMDHVGPIARSARDVALLLAVISGADPLDPTCSPRKAFDGLEGGQIEGLRVGFDPAWNACGSEPAICAAIEDALQVLERLGAKIQRVAVPDMKAAVLGWEVIAGAEAAVAHETTFPARAAEYGPALAHLIDIGRGASAIDYQRALLERMSLTGSLCRLMQDIDLLVAPVMPQAATTLDHLESVAGDAEANARLIGFTAPFDLSGQPALALPAGHTSTGSPLGIQFVGGHNGEKQILAAAIAFQNATSWHLSTPIG